MNNCIFVIRLTKDPEVRYSQEGKAIANFSGACNRRFKQEGQPDADFFNFVAFGKTAEVIEKHVKKGTKLLVEAEARNNNYKDKDGVMHYATQMIVNSIEFCESKSSESAKPSVAESAPEGEFVNVPEGIDEELPFN